MRLPTLILVVLNWTIILAEDPTKSNQVSNTNSDGTFYFGYQNNDEGGHYHEASGNVRSKVRGRYGARTPPSGKIDETVYTAGPRGFRARGSNIHRKQDLSQVPRRAIGSPTDPLADPYDDPSYGFGFKTKTHSRREEADGSGRVQGEYIYVDDVGEKHGVKYKAGANTGFQVENGVPDSPANIRYNTPLYRAEPTARGRITFERGPDRQYKFLTSSPDQRRAEATGPDGITRGSYSYLDDKGVQRTVKYIAGAGIGYKVIESTVGPGTHVAANSDVPEHAIKAVSNEIAIADNNAVPFHTGPSAPSGPSYISSTSSPTYTPEYAPTPYPPSAFSSVTPYPTPSYSPSPFASSPRPFSRPGQEPVFVTTPSSIGGIDRNYATPTIPSFPSGGPSPLSPSGPSGSGELDTIYGLLPPKEESFITNQYIPPSHPTPSGPAHIHITPPPPPTIYYQPPAPTPTVYYQQQPPPSPTPTYLPTAEAHSPQPFAPSQPGGYLPHQQFHHQPPVDAVIKNTSNGWFYGIPPGSALRAHIQNIDLVPTHDRALSPSEALWRDEERDARQHRNSHPRV